MHDTNFGRGGWFMAFEKMCFVWGRSKDWASLIWICCLECALISQRGRQMGSEVLNRLPHVPQHYLDRKGYVHACMQIVQPVVVRCSRDSPKSNWFKVDDVGVWTHTHCTPANIHLVTENGCTSHTWVWNGWVECCNDGSSSKRWVRAYLCACVLVTRKTNVICISIWSMV